ncbi:hypothetical protein LI053_15945 [Clostridium perfringens]|uniref:DUF3800 domain-containing protein n=1 Tax=Clostridium perfringens TaxID=1502 RepID=UPI0022459FB1|nr:DUF3800 domain-containing protein [Clostridium perfringens]MCX0386933.1 hypothetical protein [Clostridium perfringens]
MKFNIFFDESHQLDKHSSKYCYYGILGYEEEKISQLCSIVEDRNISYEIHFSKFKLNHIDGYLEVLRFVLNESRSNIYMVNCEHALSLGKKIDLNTENIRKLFYIKLPERLIYGMTRKMPGVKNINIVIDKSDAYGNNNLELIDENTKVNFDRIIRKEESNEDKIIQIKNIVEEKYKHIQLAKTLKEQLNSHSLYRNLNYKVNRIRQEDSAKNIALQSIDLLLGVVAYIFEEKYLDLPESFSKKVLDNKLEYIELISSEEELLFKSYKLNPKNNEYILVNKNISNDLIIKLRNINKKLNITSSKNIQKSEFIYRILTDNIMLEKLYHSDMFEWSLDNISISKNINRVYISKYINKFLNYKIKYDNNNIKILVKKYIEDIKKEIKVNKKEYAKTLELNINNTYPLIDRYFEILGIEEN